MIKHLKGFLDKDWRKKDEILAYLLSVGCPTNERSFREFVATYNQEYCNGVHDSFIAHDNRYGYKLTSSKKIIKSSIADDMKRLIALSKRVYGVKKRIANDSQIRLPIFKKELDAYEVIMKMGD